MMTIEQLRKISKSRNPKQNLLQSVASLSTQFQPYEYAHVVAQTMHESTGLVHDQEIWGPTAAQKRYDIRTDLGNTPERDGDGEKYKGHGPLQVTGRANTGEFYQWCKARGLNPPNFIEHPEKIAEHPWAAWSIVWYWSTRGLSKYAASNDIEMITRRINGGLNGYADRLEYYDRTALVMLGYAPTAIRQFQIAAKERGDYAGDVDGVSGPKTRAAMHKALSRLSTAPVAVSAAPVVEEKKVLPPSMEKPWWKSKEAIAPIVTGGGLTGAASVLQSFGGLPWQNLLILMVAGFIGLGAFLIWSRQKDKKAVNL